MTAYLDEYNPGARSPNFRVQSDPNKLRYNNIRSCIAVAVYPSHNNHLVGVHLTTATTGNVAEMKTVRDELRAQIGGSPAANAYLVANYTGHHAGTTLKRELLKIVQSVFLCDVSPISEQDTSAMVDVKMQLVAGRLIGYVRAHAEFQTNPEGQRIPKNEPQGGWLPGQPRMQMNKTGLDWQPVDFQRF
jgi:hypothetical protein